GVRRADRRVRGHPDQRRVVRAAVAAGRHADVPVLRGVLPDRPAARGAPPGGVRHAAVARGGPVPGAGPGARPPPGPGRAARGVPGAGRRRRLRRRPGHLPPRAGVMTAPATTLTGAALRRAVPRPRGGGALVLIERNLLVYRRLWSMLASG